MNTFLLKLGCLVLFGFIFFISFQTNVATPNHLLSKNSPKEKIVQPEIVMAEGTAANVLVANQTLINN